MQKQILFFLLMITIFSHSGMTQQLDKIGEEGALRTSGGISVDQVYRENAFSRGNPWSLVATGRLNASLYGLSVPLSFSWSNERWTYTQPFNRFSISPSYKWATLHLGWSSMNFSPYSLSGHSFAGVGVEVAPGENFRLSAMHGRLQKAMEGDSTHGHDPMYRRTGSGVKGTCSFDRGEVSISIFHGVDDTRKPVEYIDSLDIKPMENVVITTGLNHRLTENLAMVTELGVSLMSNDRRHNSVADLDDSETFRYHAAKTSLTYNASIGSLGGTVEYVEPGYETLGAYYTVNDFIHYTLNAATSLFNGRVTVAGSGGIRENNLDKNSDSETKDVVTNLSIGFNPADRCMFNFSYSNFSNYTHVQTLFDEVEAQTEYELMDTLRFTQISENASLSANWRISESETATHSLMFNLGWQQASQSQSDVPDHTNTTFVNASTGYQWTLSPENISLALNGNYSRNHTPGVVNEIMGPVLQFRKSFFDKTLQTSLSTSWNGTYTDGHSSGSVLTTRLSNSYTLKKKHRFALSGSYNHRERNNDTRKYYTVSLRYSYSFSWPREASEER